MNFVSGGNTSKDIKGYGERLWWQTFASNISFGGSTSWFPIDLYSWYYRHIISFRFRCEDPVIKVKISNLISFVCPVYDLRPYLENYLYANGEIYESLYFVDDNFTAYHTCDAKSKIVCCSTYWNVHKTSPEIEKQIFL